jgi:hypothetical protein
MKSLVAFAFILFSWTVTFAQKSEDNGQAIIDKFFELYKQSPDNALNYIFGTNKWLDKESEGVKNVFTELSGTIDMVGNYIGYEPLKSKKVGSRLRIASYFVYYDRQPLRFTFELYKGNEGWVMWNFKYDTSFDDEIEEAVKLIRD